MKNPTHLIKAWDGTRESEAPLCGADTYTPEVWSYRTENPEFVTCPHCLKASEKLDTTKPINEDQ